MYVEKGLKCIFLDGEDTSSSREALIKNPNKFGLLRPHYQKLAVSLVIQKDQLVNPNLKSPYKSKKNKSNEIWKS